MKTLVIIAVVGCAALTFAQEIRTDKVTALGTTGPRGIYGNGGNITHNRIIQDAAQLKQISLPPVYFVPPNVAKDHPDWSLSQILRHVTR